MITLFPLVDKGFTLPVYSFPGGIPMKCKRHIPVILIISLLFGMILTGCTQPLRSSSSVELILDTIVDIKVYGHAPQNPLDLAVDAAFDKARN